LFHDKSFDIISEENSPQYQSIVPILEYIEPIDNGDVLLDPSRISIIIDPLDATKEFTEEIDDDGTDMLPYVTTLICVVRDEIPIAGIIGRPFKMFPKNENEIAEDIMWGVNSDIHGLKIEQPNHITSSIVTISRSHTGNAVDIISHTLNKESLLAGGAGYKSLLVLTGKADAYIHVTAIKTWDLCAGHALIKAAGGDITDKDGNQLIYSKGKPKFTNGLIASLDKNKIKEYASKLKNIELNT